MIIRLLTFGILICVIGIISPISAICQTSVSITGETCVNPGSSYRYTISGSWSSSTYMEWNVSGGIIAGVNSTYKSGTPVPYIDVIWNSGTTYGYVNLYSSIGSKRIDIRMASSLQPGAIIEPKNLNVMFNDATPPTITCSPPTGGNCYSTLTYQWQISTDGGVIFSDINGETDQTLSFSAPISKSAYYRRSVTEKTSTGTITTRFSDFSQINVLPFPLLAGKIGDIYLDNNQQRLYNTSPVIYTWPAEGGSQNSIQYVWEVAYGTGLWNVFGSGEPFPSSPVLKITDDIKIRRKATCGTEFAYSSELNYFPAYSSVDYENRNYVRENTITIPRITSWYQADQLPTGQKFQSTNYFNGLGRTLQSVSKQTAQLATGWGDNVIVHEFDEYGRENKLYLPYASSTTLGKFKTDGLTEQINFIHNKFSDAGNTYATTVFENNALSRVTKTMLPGNAWGNSNIGTGYGYDFNSTEIIKKWEIDYNETDLPYTTGNYTVGQLLKTTTTDEKGKLVIEYKDFNGSLILSKVQDKEQGAGLVTDGYPGWVCTYYVYDDFGRLRFTISPKAVDYLVTNKGVDVNVNWQIDANLASELCFSNYYDNFGRLIIKHSPGAANQEMVYDQRDRIVYNRDAADKAKKRWLVNLSDGYDRPQISGVLNRNTNPASDYTRSELQTIANGVTIAPVAVSTTTAGNTGALASLIASIRETWANEYIASEEIVFNPGFETSLNDYFIARIDNTPPTPQTQQIASSGNFIPADGSLVTLSVNYYDDYKYTDAKAFSNNYSFPANSNPNILSTVSAKRTFGSLTGQKVRVIDDEDYTDDNFLMTSVYYDEYGNLLQKVSQNYLQATNQASNPYNDILTNQYDFAGKLLNSCFKESVPGTVLQNFPVNTAYEYDILGRVLSLSKSYNSQTFKKLVQYTYNELGQVVTKKLSPDYNAGTGLETLKYDFNIQGWLTGINKDYIDNGQWGSYFGMRLGYENADLKFPSTTFTKEYNGNIGGAIWKSQGDNKPRKYDYDYFNTGYLKLASFLQKEDPSASSAWNANKYDFSVPQLLYDANGNLKKMQQKGLIPGQTSSTLIDDLTYEYAGTSELTNRLNKVTDGAPTGTANGKLGDFSTTRSSQQYLYDDAGNLIKDYNKNIQDDANTNTDLQKGILYNVLNKPYKVTIKDKFVMQYVYDAAGNKLARKITNTSVTPNTSKWQYYINDMVLEDYEVQFFVNETGRLRVSKDVSFRYDPAPALTIAGNNGMVINGKPAFFDFYITDHLDNTRMVLTEEEHTETHKATMEVADAREKAYEEGMFGKVDANGQPAAGNELIATRIDMPLAWSSHYNDANNKKASKLNQSSPVGPNAFLKVMAGDVLNLHTDYFYNETPTNGGSIENTIISSLVNTLSGSSAATGGVKSFSSQIQTQLSAPGDFTNFLNNPTGTATPPNAHLNWLFFDENFNPVSQGATRVSTAGDNQSITVSNVTVPANGYAFVYLSNSSNISVYFDEFWVTHKRGRILQENHYYPYGLQIASISSKAAGKMDNMYRYQGAYSEWEEETGWNDFELRTYDAQVGRFINADPYDQFASLYTGMGNNPINTIDPSGGLGIDFGTIGDITGSVLGDRLLAAGAGAAIGYGIDRLTGGKGGWGAAIGAGVGFGATFIQPFDIGSIFSGGGNSDLVQGADAVMRHVPAETVNILRDLTPASPPTNLPNRLLSINIPAPRLVQQHPLLGTYNVSTLAMSDNGFNFLAQREGVVLHPYNDSRGYATVGVGHLIGYRPVTQQDRINWAWLDTRPEALELFRNDLRSNYEPGVRRLIRVPLTQPQYDAIVSFTYNVGIGSATRGTGLAGSLFLRELNAGRPNGDLMLRFRRPPEIIGRRQREARLFNTGRY